MKNCKLIHSNYNKETGLSMAVIGTKHGEFIGLAQLHEEDKDIESNFFGCRYAEIRALVKAAKAEKKEVAAQLHVLEVLKKDLENMKTYNPNSLEASKIRRKIYELSAKKATIEKAIKDSQANLIKLMESDAVYARKLKAKKGKTE